jgi:hypothetical protein
MGLARQPVEEHGHREADGTARQQTIVVIGVRDRDDGDDGYSTAKAAGTHDEVRSS